VPGALACLRLVLQSLCDFSSWYFERKRSRNRKFLLEKTRKKNHAGSENHSPHWLRKMSHFGTEYRKAPPPRKEKEKVNGDQEGCRLGLKPVPDES